MDPVLLSLRKGGKLPANYDSLYSSWIDLAGEISKEIQWNPEIPQISRTAIPAACLEIAALILGTPRLSREDYRGTNCLAKNIYEKILSKIFEVVMVHGTLKKPSLEAVAQNYDSPQLVRWAQQLVGQYERAKELAPGEQPLAFIAAFSLLLPQKTNPYPVSPKTLKTVVAAMKPLVRDLEKNVDFRQALNTKPNPKESRQINADEGDSFSLEIEPVSSKDDSNAASDPDFPFNDQADPAEGSTAFFKKYSHHRPHILHTTIPFWETAQFSIAMQRMKSSGWLSQ